MNTIEATDTNEVQGAWRSFGIGLAVNLVYDVVKTLANDQGGGNNETNTNTDAMGNRTTG